MTGPAVPSGLEALLAQATPPLRIAGIPPGVISASDYDVTDEVLELWPDAVRLLVDMAAELEKHASYDQDYINKPKAEHLLARFAALDRRAGTP